MLSTGIVRNPDGKLRLLVDAGTNGEIVLGSTEAALATAAPAGPAFEGAQIRCGMRATEGAIEGVQITGDEVRLQLIGQEGKPRGICVSGLVDVVAELVPTGLVNPSGRLLRPDQAMAACPKSWWLAW